MTAANEHPIERALSFARLPESLEGRRVLEVGDVGAAREFLEGLGATEFVALEDVSESAELGAGGFGLAICGSGAGGDLHPLALYAWLRRAMEPDGILVAGSAVLPDPKLSQYARFVPGRAPEPARWIPGRLAFRWMVEVSGFEMVSWLGSRDGEEATRAHLQAKAVERAPALDLERQPLGR
ncbi:MAG TPA: hypothetical protein VFJ53_04250 [Solirubrobacterales bacterium]|nr:hypothetical protein [Solirubrobacterales bacterium]